MYFVGTKPGSFQGEYLTKDPIAITPTDGYQVMSSAARLHYAKVYLIEMNVKVKDIGDVVPEDLHNLISNYKEMQ